MKRVIRAVCFGTLVVAVHSVSAQAPAPLSGYLDSIQSPFPASADEHRALPAFTTFADTHPIDPKQYTGSPFPPNADEHRALAAFESYAERVARQAMAQRMTTEAPKDTRTE